jgi:hypothetical protein
LSRNFAACIAEKANYSLVPAANLDEMSPPETAAPERPYSGISESTDKINIHEA